MKSISVIGNGNVSEGSEFYEVAEQAGYLIGSAGYVLITGGLLGVMEAASKGAKKAGGLTVGILPSYEVESANRFVDVKIATGMWQARNIIVISSSDLIVAIGGGYGTLSEISHSLKIGGKKVIGYKTWDVRGVENYDDRDRFLEGLSVILERL